MKSTPRETTAETVARILTVAAMPCKVLIRSDVKSIRTGQVLVSPSGHEHHVAYHFTRCWYDDGSREYFVGDQKRIAPEILNQIWND